MLDAKNQTESPKYPPGWGAKTKNQQSPHSQQAQNMLALSEQAI